MSDNTILVVDDDLAILDMIAELLGYEGYRVITCRSSKDALVQAKAYTPALILLDLMMPEMSGWQVISALRSMPQTSSVPIVLISAWRDLPATAKELDVPHFLEKPFDLDEVLVLVQQYVIQ